eukprot:scpid101944/ scgid22023/ 
MILFAGSEPRLRGITDQPCTAGVDCEEIVFHFSVFVCAYDAAYIADHLRTEHMEPEFTFTLNLRRFPSTILKVYVRGEAALCPGLEWTVSWCTVQYSVALSRDWEDWRTIKAKSRRSRKT